MKKSKKHIKEGISQDDVKLLRKLIRQEIANIYFDLYRKKSVWGGQ
tara:strand:+ start:308 stop:445 length:138 start_codon:yes stop_codon:yes gene_type:complete